MDKLTTAQAAARLDVTDRSVRNYIEREALPAEKAAQGMDWRYLIDVRDLEAFAETQGIVLQSV